MRKGIESLFAGRTLVSLLKVFLFHPESRFYQRELERLTGESLLTIQRELKRLQEIDLITKTVSGNRLYYQLDSRSPIAQDLKALFLKTLFRPDILGKTLGKVKDKIKIAFLYGSAARGEEKEKSDLDLMIIGSLSARETAELLNPIKKQLNREINPVIYTLEEFREKYLQGHHFINAVLKELKIYLVGEENELGKILSRGSA